MVTVSRMELSIVLYYQVSSVTIVTRIRDDQGIWGFDPPIRA